jgi:hypothetical protein
MARTINISLMRLRVSRWSCLAVLLVIPLGFAADVALVAGPGATTEKVLQRFSLATDRSVPTFVASILLLTCAALLALSARAEAAEGRRRAWPWWLLAWTFALLALDEVAMLHELAGEVLERLVPQIEALGPAFHYAWTLVAIPVLLLLAALLAPWFFALAWRTQVLFGASAVLFVGGAVGVEMVNSAIDAAVIGRSLAYSLLTGFEEALEFTGVLLFQFALLRHLASNPFDLAVDLR